jgi:hypothetical protein
MQYDDRFLIWLAVAMALAVALAYSASPREPVCLTDARWPCPEIH